MVLGRCASLIGLQRNANTDRVSNDRVSRVGRSLDDLTATLANESKTLLEVIDRQTKYQTGGIPSLSPPAWQIAAADTPSGRRISNPPSTLAEAVDHPTICS